MEHLNHKIHQFGVDILQKYRLADGKGFEKRQGRPIPLWMEWHNEMTNKTDWYPVKVFVKPHIFEYGTKVTGRNTDILESIREKGMSMGKPVIVVFVDAAEGWIYANFLGALQQSVRVGALSFPKQKIYANGSITYFAVEKQFKMLHKIELEDLTKLKALHFTNGTDENQTTIFD